MDVPQVQEPDVLLDVNELEVDKLTQILRILSQTVRETVRERVWTRPRSCSRTSSTGCR
jgi:hypothetical protein